MNLREAKESDIEITYRIKCNSIKPYVEKLWNWNESEQRESHKNNFDTANTKIIERKEIAIGYIVFKETDNEIYLENLLIEEKFQNLGIGKEIMENIIERANTEKKIIRLQVFKINTKAQRFYRNLGFKRASEKENHIEMKKDRNGSSIPK